MGAEFIVLPVIGAAIGWVTNVIAIKLIFRPQIPIRIPVLNIELQGLLPRRKEEIARTVGSTVADELLTAEVIMDYLEQEHFREELTRAVFTFLERRVSERMPGIVPRSLSDSFTAYLKEVLEQEMDILYIQILRDVEGELQEGTQLRKLVEKRVRKLNVGELEAIVLRTARRELKHIESLGAVLGFFIGFSQAVLLHFM